jgi:hypothetical protein
LKHTTPPDATSMNRKAVILRRTARTAGSQA